MKRSFKKMIAVLCAIAMVVTSVTVYNTQTAVASANATANGKVYTVTDGTNEGLTGFTCNGMEIFNETDGHIGFAWGEKVDSESIKVSINDAEVTTYNATANGIFVNYSQFKDFADGEYPILVTATTSGETAKDVKGNATLKIQDQGETEPAVTDPSAVKWDDISWLGNETTPTPADIVLDQELAAPADDNNYQVGGYNVYVGKWNGSTAVAGIDAADKNHIKIQQKTCQNWDPWGIQVGKKVAGLTPGETYTYTVEMKASPVDGNYKKTGDDTLYPLQAEQTVEIQVTATEDGAADFVIGLGGVGLAVVVDINNPILKDSKGNVVDMDKTGDVETTPDAVETTTPDAAETTTPSVVETTTQASATTEAPKTTTAAPKVTTKKALGKTTVKSASKKKAATKVKLTFKKVKGAKKYQVQISKTKKFKKVLVKKTVKKVKVTIKSKKVKNQKKLYVRVRAVGAKKWSKAKKIKIKK